MMRSFVKLTSPNKGGSKAETRRLNDIHLRRDIVTWRPFRIFGVLTSVAGIIFTLISVCSKYWIQGTGFHVGVWDVCFVSVTPQKTTEICKDKKPAWQNVVIGLMIFSMAFGLLATVLSVVGVCITTISRKIYYYHSSGEIYLVCALCMKAALILYPACSRAEKRVNDFQFGIGYGIGWGSVFFFFASAMCMCLDDLVRFVAREICHWDDNKNRDYVV